jgi:acyl transferase domain-containing protein
MNSAETLEDGIAIVGMAGRFPGARNIDEFWQNLLQGVESITFFSEEDMIASGPDPQLLRHPRYVNAHGVMEDIEYFDASFFGFSPREAEMMDPQYRIFLECAWEALEHAGYDTTAYKGRIGVYAGSSMNAYANLLLAKRDLIASVGMEQFLQGNAKDYLATRVSYKLNLRGPSIAVQTACSTSLVAVHLACQSLYNSECDMALAGGISIAVPQKVGRIYQEGGVASPDGHCRAFSDQAQGIVGGSGVGIVVLKPLRDAIEDGDSIYAVIKGSAINNDGASKVGYMAPSVTGQAQVIVEAQALANVNPETITYIEAHGTGTPLGDPVEIAALTQAFRARTKKKGYCAIGSVKTNIGHLDAAAGVAGLIKAVLALKHGLIPPSLNCEEPNPEIDFATSPFYVNTRLSEWKRGSYPRRAGVSSFGIGGTNAHVVLEEAPAVEPTGACRPWQLLVLSAKSDSALETATANLAWYLKEHPDFHLADVAYTSQNGRRGFGHRRIAVCRDVADAAAVLETRDPRRLFSAIQESRNRPVVFMFPGMGAQYSTMGQELYQQEPLFREQVDRCAELLIPHLGCDLRTVLYPAAPQAETSARQLRRTALGMSALFVTEYAMAQLWMAWGVNPQAMIGHSLGEYVAACLAGVFSLPDALAVVALRGRLLDQLPAGAMLSVPLAAHELQPLLTAGLSLAAVNGPALCVVSGSKDAIAEMETALTLRDLEVRRVATDTALHSDMVTPVLEPFTQFVEHLRLQAPHLPYLSNVTGTWITAQEATSPSYWATHLRQTVRFAEGMQTLLQEADLLCLEVGPGHTLSMLARQHIDNTQQHSVFSSLGYAREQQAELVSLLTTVGQLWLAGASIDWARFAAHQRRRRIPLPTYPFKRQRYWVESQQHAASTSHMEAARTVREEHKVYMPSWKRATLALVDWEALAARGQCWLVFADEGGQASRIVNRLRDNGQQVIMVTAGSQWSKVSDGGYTLDPCRAEDYEALLAELGASNRLPDRIIHLWGVTPGEQTPGEHFARGFSSLLLLARALGDRPRTQPLEFVVVSNNVQEVTGAETLCPEKATALGPCTVISQEYPYIICRAVDIELPRSGTWQEEQLPDYLLAEFAAGSSERVVAYRGNHRWIEVSEEVDLGMAPAQTTRLREKECYLIVDGPADAGLLLAEGLARTHPARLVIVEPPAFPPPDAWEQWLATHDKHNWIGQRISQVRALAEAGIEALVLCADITDHANMQRVIAQAYEHAGVIHGIISMAGFVEDTFFSTMREARPGACEDYLQAKMAELAALEQVLQGQKLDFCLVCSSLSSVFGGTGGVVDVATRRLIDTFVDRHNQAAPGSWRSVTWDTWRLDTTQEQQADLEAPLSAFALTPADVAEVLGRLPSTLATRLLVLAGDLQTRYATWLEREQIRARAQQSNADSSSLHARPDLQTPYVAPDNEIQQMIAVLWQELLGIERVGIYDNFFELGGHSLMAAKFIVRLREALLLEIPVKSIFESPTIAGVAEVAEQLFVEKIEQLSDEEAERLMSSVFHHEKG